jgi:nitrite reductase (NADH) small subunit
MNATVRLNHNDAIYNLGSLEQIPIGEGRTFQLGRIAVAVFRARDGKVLATQALCPHKEGLLADGLIGNNRVVCPLHAYKFSLLTGQPIGNQCEALETYTVSLNETGDILLMLNHQTCTEEANRYEPSQPSAYCSFGSANE